MKQDRQIQIESALPRYRQAWAKMRRALYPQEPIATIENEIEEFDRIGAIDGRAHGVFVALDDGEAVGFVEVSDLGSTACHIESWYVRPDSRQAGVGRALIGASESWARSRGANILTSDTNEDYPDSLPAHKGCGFAASEDNTLFEKLLGD